MDTRCRALSIIVSRSSSKSSVKITEKINLEHQYLVQVYQSLLYLLNDAAYISLHKISHAVPAAKPGECQSTNDFDTSDSDERLRTTSRSHLDPVPPTPASVPPAPDPQLENLTAPIRELQKRERELSKRTALIESLLLNLTTTLNQRAPPPSIFTPVSQFPGFIPPFGTAAPAEQSTQHPSLLPPRSPFATFSNSFSDSTLRDALELVPKFGGHNMPVLQFARACKMAKDLLPFTRCISSAYCETYSRDTLI